MKIYQSLIELVGNTPLVALHGYERAVHANAQLIAKLESQNPLRSAKDRVGLAMIEQAEKDGLLVPGATIIEPTSGNTGIGLAFVAAIRGYRMILTMPETMSLERRQLLSALGAELVLTEGAKGMQGAIDKAEELHRQITPSFIPQQFENPANPQAHVDTTGPEIWRDTDGTVDIFVAGVGTGGTLSGVGRVLKAHNPAIQIVAVEPAKSPLLSGGKAGAHGLQGIGANFIPKNLDRSIVDAVIPVLEEDAYEACRTLAKTDGILAGISSGAALWAASQLAQKEEHAGKKIVVLLPDTGERYLSSGLYQ